MLMMTAFALSLFFFAPPAARPPRSAAPSGESTSTVKPARHDEGRSMNGNRNAVMDFQGSQALASEISTVADYSRADYVEASWGISTTRVGKR
jgi:hypothetical protein